MSEKSATKDGFMVSPMPVIVSEPEIKFRSRLALNLSDSLIANKTNLIAVFISLVIIGIQSALIANPVLGIYADIIGLALLMATALRFESARKLAILSAILPLMTLLSVSFNQGTDVQQAFVFYDVLMLLVIVYRFAFSLDKPVRLNSISKKQSIALYIFSLVLGVSAGLVGYLLLNNQFDFQSLSLPVAAAAVSFFAIIEEMFYRGILQRLANNIMAPLAAAGLTVVLWTFMNLSSNIWSGLLFGLFSGIMLSGLYFIRQSVVYTIPANIAMKLTYLLLAFRFFLH